MYFCVPQQNLMQQGSVGDFGDVAEKVNIMDGYLKGLLSHWLGVGLLKLELLTWHSPAALLEKVNCHG